MAGIVCVSLLLSLAFVAASKPLVEAQDAAAQLFRSKRSSECYYKYETHRYYRYVKNDSPSRPVTCTDYCYTIDKFPYCLQEQCLCTDVKGPPPVLGDIRDVPSVTGPHTGGGISSTGGFPSVGLPSSGGLPSTGSPIYGGFPSAVGFPTSGSPSTGGFPAIGGFPLGGLPPTPIYGGFPSAGRPSLTGGLPSQGGFPSTGGSAIPGGLPSTTGYLPLQGGFPSIAGFPSTGGSSTLPSQGLINWGGQGGY